MSYPDETWDYHVTTCAGTDHPNAPEDPCSTFAVEWQSDPVTRATGWRARCGCGWQPGRLHTYPERAIDDLAYLGHVAQPGRDTTSYPPLVWDRSAPDPLPLHRCGHPIGAGIHRTPLEVTRCLLAQLPVPEGESVTIRLTEVVRVHNPGALLAYANLHRAAWGLSSDEPITLEMACREAVVLAATNPLEAGFEIVGSSQEMLES